MAKEIDLRDLSEDEAKLIQELVDFFKEKARKRRKPHLKEERDVAFAAHQSDVIGKITRKEIYDYL